MKTRNRFILFSAFLHGTMALMAALFLEYNTMYFILTEALILVSVVLSINLYMAFMKPLNILTAGMESMKDQDFSMKFVKVGHHELDQLIEVYNKMIDQLREERISNNEQQFFLDKLVQASPSGIIVLDYDNQILNLNLSAQKYLNVKVEQVAGKPLHQIPNPLSLPLNELAPGSSKVIQGNGHTMYKCHKAQFIHKGFHQHFIIIEELTNEILLAEKKAYEKVIRMMSHEINNTVGAVNSILDSLQKTKFYDDEDSGTVLRVCTDRNKRMARFMSNFADVVRLPDVKLKQNDLHILLKNTALLFENIFLQKNICINLQLEGNTFLLLFDEQQMEQVIINILKNAVESIGEDGQVSIITSLTPPQLIIRDSGKGIDPVFQHKLFSPFFSSKKEGQGIGLTLTKEILHNHNFKFSLASNPGGYTDFTIYF